MKFPRFSETQVEATAVICGAMAFFFELVGNRVLFASFGIPAIIATVWAFISQSSKPNWKPKLKLKEGKIKVNTIIKLGALFLIITLVGFVGAQLAQNYLMPQGAEIVVKNPAITATLAGSPWTNDTHVDWGNLEANGTYAFENFTVVNVSAETLNLTWINIDLPGGWMETWTPNATILLPDEVATGSLTLYVADNATTGSYSWTSKLTVT